MYGSLKSAMKQATLYLIFICVKKITVYSPTPPPLSKPNLAEKHAAWGNASFSVKFVRCKSKLTDFYL